MEPFQRKSNHEKYNDSPPLPSKARSTLPEADERFSRSTFVEADQESEQAAYFPPSKPTNPIPLSGVSASTFHLLNTNPFSNPSRRSTMHTTPSSSKSNTRPSRQTSFLSHHSLDDDLSITSETKRATQKRPAVSDSARQPKKRTTETIEKSVVEWDDPLDKQSTLNQRIRVCVRKRPLNTKESNSHQTDIVSIYGSNSIHVNAPK
jgi:hypothetical protein